MFKLFTDGGARGNPGPSACACVIYTDSNEVLDMNGKYLDTSTNNFAEYSGLLIGLDLALKNDIEELSCFLDSELVVKQIKGLYKVSNPEMKKLYNKVMEKVSKFKKIDFNHIERSKNKFADKLVNIILDAVK
jgi:ribonuclease HI